MKEFFCSNFDLLTSILLSFFNPQSTRLTPANGSSSCCAEMSVVVAPGNFFTRKKRKKNTKWKKNDSKMQLMVFMKHKLKGCNFIVGQKNWDLMAN